jgi:hypothetical protein
MVLETTCRARAHDSQLGQDEKDELWTSSTRRFTAETIRRIMDEHDESAGRAGGQPMKARRWT